MFTSPTPWVEDPEGYKSPNTPVSYKGSVFVNKWWTQAIESPDYWKRAPPGQPDYSNPWILLHEIPTHNPPTPQGKVISYILADKLATANDDRLYKSITHLIVSFIMFNSSGALDLASVSTVRNMLAGDANAKERCRTHQVKCMVAVGGATDENFNKLLVDADRQPELIDTLADAIYEFVVESGIDGVDLDLEAWWAFSPEESERFSEDGPAPAGKSLTKLARKLKEKFAGTNKIVSAALPASGYYGNNFEGKALAQHVDWLGVMTYDLNGSWATSPVGPHSQSLMTLLHEQQLEHTEEQQRNDWNVTIFPMISAQESLYYWTNPNYVNYRGHGQAVPIEKMVIGSPLYGYDYSHQSEAGLTAYNTVLYKQLYETFGSKVFSTANIKEKGVTPSPAFIPEASRKYPNGYPWSHNVYYDNPTEAVKKMKYIRKVGGQGVMTWEASGDYLGPADKPGVPHEHSILKALWDHSDSTKEANNVGPGRRGAPYGPAGVKAYVPTKHDKHH